MSGAREIVNIQGSHIVKNDEASLRSIVASKAWDAVLREAQKAITEWNADTVNGENEFQTLRMLFIQQGKVEGVKEFLNRLEKPSSEQK